MTYNSKLHSVSKANRFENGEVNDGRVQTEQYRVPSRDSMRASGIDKQARGANSMRLCDLDYFPKLARLGVVSICRR
ncbi:MAG: hypothetical protein DMF07_04425 [Verrucomicrobia bacterium]|nr:MAG: hypothetical protein DMF07_04425 [Verrucomicrobiota bacterium]